MVFLAYDENVSTALNDSGDLLHTTAAWASGGGGGGVNASDDLARGSEVHELVSKATVERVTLALGLVLIPTLAVVGVVGNVLSLVVLVQHRMRSTTNICLAALAVSDLLLLLHSLAFSAIRFYGLRDPEGALRAQRHSYPVLGAYGSIVCARITTWLTTMLAVERCIAVYLPMRAKTINSRRNTQVAIAVIYTLTLLAFLPTALQYRVVTVVTASNVTLPKLALSSLGRNTTFTLAYGLALNVLFRFVPLVVLVVVNALITVAIRRTHALRHSMSWGHGGQRGQGSRCGGQGHGEQTRITLMLLTVSGVFLVCTLPGAINTIVSRVLTSSYSRLGSQANLYRILSLVTYCLETLNSSVNFVIYMAFSRKFCHTYHEIFCCRSSPWQPWQASLRTVRFAPRALSSTSLRSSHEMHCMQYRPLPKPPYTNSNTSGGGGNGGSAGSGGSAGGGAGGGGGGGGQRARFHSNGFLRSSFDVEDVQLINGRSPVANSNLPLHGSCCTCNKRRRSQSQSNSRSRSQSQSHSSDSAAQQFS